MKNFLLALSALLYGVIAVLHGVRYFSKWPVTIGTAAIPLEASLWAGGIFLALSLIYFVAARGKS